MLNFRSEITLAIALKLCALTLLWMLFFSHQKIKKEDTLAQHFLHRTVRHKEV